MATAARPLERSVVSLSRSEARRSRITAHAARDAAGDRHRRTAAASRRATSATMITVRLPPVAIAAAPTDAASLNSSDCASTAWFFSTKVSKAGRVALLAVRARRRRRRPRGRARRVRATESSSACRRPRHSSQARAACRARRGGAASASDSAKASPSLLFQAALEPAVERGRGAVEDRAGLDVERLTGGDLHRHDLLIEDRAALGVSGAIGERTHLGHGHGRSDEHEEEGQREGGGELGAERRRDMDGSLRKVRTMTRISGLVGKPLGGLSRLSPPRARRR